MTWLKSEEEVDKLIEEMKQRSKGRYITQGVAFNKSCPRQMDMLKKALMSSVSFSGLVKEMLALRFYESKTENRNVVIEKPKIKNTGNFL